jgi:LPXTG-motif cell wall-anchored protein
MHWIFDNKEWIFSGIGVLAISTMGGFIFRKKKPQQSIKSGKFSQNFQSGRDLNIKIGNFDNEK